MPANSNATFLLASSEPTLLASIEPELAASGAKVQVVLSAEAALVALAGLRPPSLALIDANLRCMDAAMNVGRLLAAASSVPAARRCAVVLISDTVTEEWSKRMAEGVIHDLIPPSTEPTFLRLRLDTALRTHRITRELEKLCESAASEAQMDHLTGAYNRDAMLGMLFRETDRVQRMKTALSLVLFDIDDFRHWNTCLGVDACDELLRQVSARTARLLRSYDLLGRMGSDEFLLAMPGCSNVTATMLAERLRLEVFSMPFRLGGDSIRLTACFGIASSHGRSPLVVLREAEQALQWAKAEGPESIQGLGESQQCLPAPIAFLSQSSGDGLAAW